MPEVYVDAEGAVRAWLNGLLELVGPGNPIALGAFEEDPLRSPASGAYVLLARVGGTSALTAEAPVDRARISGQVYGETKQVAKLAAYAYANALAGLDGTPTPMGEHAICKVVDSIAGPSYVDDHATTRERHRYLVDADFYLGLA